MSKKRFRKVMVANGAIALGSFLLSVLFKIFHLMGAPTLLMISALFGCLFLGTFVVYRLIKH